MRISSGIAEGQVLQRLNSRRGANVTLTGSSGSSKRLLITISDTQGPLRGWFLRGIGKATEGKFSIDLCDIPAGGPYRIALSVEGSNERAIIENFFVGDVWILAGQSNMEGAGNCDAAAKPHPLIRSFSMRRNWQLAKDPLHVLAESPDPCHNSERQCTPAEGKHLREAAHTGVGVGIFFAREMLARSGVPQGLLCTAHGGTSMTQWSPTDKKNMYASMLGSWKATGQAAAGLLWYQGESDANLIDSPLYIKRMKSLVAASRRDLRQPALPWIIVQIARVVGLRSLGDTIGWNTIQEHQRRLPDVIPYLETVAAIDLELDDSIHIAAHSFPLLADRMARVADRIVYRNPCEKRPPQLAKIDEPVVDGRDPGKTTLDVHFTAVVGGLMAHGEPQGFAFVTPDGLEQKVIFKTTLHGSFARLHFQLENIIGYRISYGHGVSPACSIRDGRGFSLPVFGPLPVGRELAYLSFIRTWMVSKIITNACPLGELEYADIKAHVFRKKTYAIDGIANERASWKGHTGQNYFHTQIDLPETMKLNFLMGYHGPFRLWLDGEPLFSDLDGRNSFYMNASRHSAILGAGLHDITVAMDLMCGAAWGFFLRLERRDVSSARIKSGDYAKPIFLK